jgi:hypothetical protein
MQIWHIILVSTLETTLVTMLVLINVTKHAISHFLRFFVLCLQFRNLSIFIFHDLRNLNKKLEENYGI